MNLSLDRFSESGVDNINFGDKFINLRQYHSRQRGNGVHSFGQMNEWATKTLQIMHWQCSSSSWQQMIWSEVQCGLILWYPAAKHWLITSIQTTSLHCMELLKALIKHCYFMYASGSILFITGQLHLDGHGDRRRGHTKLGRRDPRSTNAPWSDPIIEYIGCKHCKLQLIYRSIDWSYLGLVMLIFHVQAIPEWSSSQ